MNILFSKTLSHMAIALSLFTVIPQQVDAQNLRFGNRAARTWTIAKPGNYTLRRNLSAAEGDAIVISADNVTLNLNGFSVNAPTAGSGRGIVITGDSVSVHGGNVGGFQTNVAVEGADNVTLHGLQIKGEGLAPDGGPSEIGIMLVNSQSCAIRGNNISSVNLGIFVRGGASTGNRIEKNVVVGSATAANNIFGICYNPAPEEGDAGPRGDSIYNNHIARFNYAVSVSDASIANIFADNTLSSFTGPFRNPAVFEAQGGTNAEFDNIATTIPNEDL